ncbi:DUF4054 domain-containing protein [uncultured Paraglaciecola sp.]|uniref:DUF4054 domain-containing protein n=1 Tax=uncultured Paraglaciecola sp. TaxID=1765024 RepID=UPI0026137CBF|nr:DUF4054 domain-containing protein [uncultured Paraglaciecola sp.]
MDLDTITVSDFKTYFRRDFPYAPDDANFCSNSDTYIFDEDITKAFGEAKMMLNQALFSSDDGITIAYQYLTAHYLVHDINTGLQGVESTGNNPVSSRSVGSVSESYSIPQRYLDDPQLSFFTNTGYGMKYLSLILPALAGNVGSVCGATNP